jgi:hypothetical protein
MPDAAPERGHRRAPRAKAAARRDAADAARVGGRIGAAAVERSRAPYQHDCTANSSASTGPFSAVASAAPPAAAASDRHRHAAKPARLDRAAPLLAPRRDERHRHHRHQRRRHRGRRHQTGGDARAPAAPGAARGS